MAEWIDLDEAFAELEANLTAVTRGIVAQVWHGVLAKSPQYHGRMAASWNYSLNAEVYVDRSKQVDFVGPRKTQIGRLEPSPGLYRGHPAAIAVANQAVAGRDSAFKLGDVVWLTNGADHGEGAYAGLIEDGKVNLRAVNLPGRMLGRTLDQIESSYGGGVSRQRAAVLATMRIGS